MITTYYWEDLEPGLHLDLGQYFLSEEELLSFAQQYDPLTFHTDPEAAKETPIGVLCASGVHTIAIAQRLIVEGLLKKTAVVAGMGVDKVSFHRPVLPNETIAVSITVTKRNQPIKNLGKGRVFYSVKAYNPRKELAFSMIAKLLVLCRPTSE